MKNKKQVINYIFIVILLLMSAINLNNYFKPKQVLGIRNEETEISTDIFWQDFSRKHPKYLPALIELGEISKVKKLDPNFLARP